MTYDPVNRTFDIARAQRIHPDLQSVVVTGAGPIGLGVLAMAKIIRCQCSSPM